MNLRDLARDQDCTVRLESVCNCNPETTVLAHFRMIDISGAGMKSSDLLGAWACSACHDAIDRRAHMDLDRDFVQLAHLKGVMRTQAQLLKRGVLRLTTKKD